MDKTTEENKTISPELQDLLKRITEEIDKTLHHSRRVMLIDMITHINSLNRDTYYINKDLYSKLMVILNIAMKAGKEYLDEL